MSTLTVDTLKTARSSITRKATITIITTLILITIMVTRTTITFILKGRRNVNTAITIRAPIPTIAVETLRATRATSDYEQFRQ